MRPDQKLEPHKIHKWEASVLHFFTELLIPSSTVDDLGQIDTTEFVHMYTISLVKDNKHKTTEKR